MTISIPKEVFNPWFKNPYLYIGGENLSERAPDVASYRMSVEIEVKVGVRSACYVQDIPKSGLPNSSLVYKFMSVNFFITYGFFRCCTELQHRISKHRYLKQFDILNNL